MSKKKKYIGNAYAPTKSQRNRKRQKQKMDEAVMKFVTVCAECAKYDDGRCVKYNDKMDKFIEEGKVPKCDSAEPIEADE